MLSIHKLKTRWTGGGGCCEWRVGIVYGLFALAWLEKNGTGNLAASEGGFLGVEMILWMSRKLQKEQGA